jgi:signal peptidase I
MAQVKKQQQGFFATVREIVVLLLIVFLIRTFGFGLYQVPSGSMETTMLVGERFFADKFTYLFVHPKHGDVIACNSPVFNYSKNPVIRLFQDYVWGPENWTKRIIGVPGDIIKGVIEDGKPVVYRNGEKLNEPYINKYPLIALWPENIALLRQKLKEQVIPFRIEEQLGPQGLNAYIDQMIINNVNIPWRSYDAAYSFEDQPFYRMEPSEVARDPQGNPYFKVPGTPIAPVVSQAEKPAGSYWNGTDEFYIELGSTQYWVMGDNRLGSQDSRFFGPLEQRLIHGRILFRIWSLDSYESWWIVDLLKHPIDFWKRMRWSRFFEWVR